MERDGKTGSNRQLWPVLAGLFHHGVQRFGSAHHAAHRGLAACRNAGVGQFPAHDGLSLVSAAVGTRRRADEPHRPQADRPAGRCPGGLGPADGLFRRRRGAGRLFRGLRFAGNRLHGHSGVGQPHAGYARSERPDVGLPHAGAGFPQYGAVVAGSRRDAARLAGRFVGAVAAPLRPC